MRVLVRLRNETSLTLKVIDVVLMGAEWSGYEIKKDAPLGSGKTLVGVPVPTQTGNAFSGTITVRSYFHSQNFTLDFSVPQAGAPIFQRVDGYRDLNVSVTCQNEGGGQVPDQWVIVMRFTN